MRRGALIRIAVLTALLADPAWLPSRAQTGPQQPAAAADGRGAVRIEAPAVVLVEAASESALPIGIGPIERVPRNSLLRVRGIPAKAALSEGHSVGPGAWAVPMGSVPRLRIIVPAGLSGKSSVLLALVTIDGEVVAETRFALLIGVAGLIAPDGPREEPAPAVEPSPPQVSAGAAFVAPPAPASAGPPPPAADQAAPAAPPLSPPRLSPEAETRAQGLVARGEQLLKNSDVVSARLFFERAADAGLAAGALALAGTYDPHELVRVRIVGLKPDPVAARRWYERARDLGSAEAAERLVRLGQ